MLLMVAPAFAQASAEEESGEAEVAAQMSPQEEFFSRIRAVAVETIDLARQSRTAETRNEAARLSIEALRMGTLAVEILRVAAERGLDGEAGEAASVLVERAISDARAAATAASERPSEQDVAAADVAVTGFYEWMGDWELNNTRGGINLSTFIFMDIDRDGDYTAADKPMPGVITALYRDGVRVAQADSNANGFSNFRSSRFESDAVIRETGAYEFRVAIPAGWKVSTDNATQSIDVKEVYGSIGGLGASRMPDPIGLMPILSVQGQASSGTAGQPVTLEDSETGTEWKAVLDETLHFHFDDLPASEYVLRHTDRSLPVSVRRFPVHVGDVSTDRASEPANQLAHFNDIDGSGLYKVPNGYAGVRWFNLNAMRKNFSSGSVGYVNGTISGDFHVYTSSGHPASFYAAEPFALYEMAVSVAWCDGHGEILEIEFLRGEEVIGRDTVTLSCLGPVIYRPERAGITAVNLSTRHFWQAVLDDISLRVTE